MDDGNALTKAASIYPSPYGFEGDLLELPIVLVTALAECDVPLASFIDRVQRGSLWQDEAIRSSDRRIVVQAHLAAEGLRAIVQIGEKAFYHVSAATLHVFDLVLPSTVLVVRDLEASCLLDDPLFRLLGVRIRKMKPLDHLDPGMGTTRLLHVPSITTWIPQIP